MRLRYLTPVILQITKIIATDPQLGCAFSDDVFQDYLALVSGSTNSGKLSRCWYDYHNWDVNSAPDYLQVYPKVDSEVLSNGQSIHTWYRNRMERVGRGDMMGALKRVCTFECKGSNQMHRRGKVTHRVPLIMCKCRPLSIDENGEEKHDCKWKVGSNKLRNNFTCMGGESYSRNVEVNIEQFIDDTEVTVDTEETGDFGRSDDIMGGETENGENGAFDRDITEYLFNDAVSEESPLGSTQDMVTDGATQRMVEVVELTTELTTESTAESTTVELTTTESTTTESTTIESTTTEQTTTEQTTLEPKTAPARGTFTLPTTAEPTTIEQTTLEPKTAPTRVATTSTTSTKAPKTFNFDTILVPSGQTCTDRNAGVKNPINIGSFNLGTYFGKKKYTNEHVMTLIQQIIASKFDVIAVQGIRDRMRKAADELIHWVNLNPQNRKFEQVVSERVGEGSTREQFTFIYDTEKLELVNKFQIHDGIDPAGKVIAKDPFIGHFRRIDEHAAHASIQEFSFLTFHSRVRKFDPAEEADNVPHALSHVVNKLGFPVHSIIAADLSIDDDLVNEKGVRSGSCGGFTLNDLNTLKIRSDPSYTWLIDDTVDTLTETPEDCVGPIQDCKHNCAYDRLITTTRAVTNATCNTQVIDFSRLVGEDGKITDVSHHFPLMTELY